MQKKYECPRCLKKLRDHKKYSGHIIIHYSGGGDSRNAAMMAEELGGRGLSYAKVVKALTNLRVWNKRLHPAITRIADEDYNWLERHANA